MSINTEQLTTINSIYSGFSYITKMKSIENIPLEDSIKDKSLNKKSTQIRSIALKDVSEKKYTRRSINNITYERIKSAKLKVDDAIQKGKVFTVLGPYKRIREVLRNRGWVEKFYLNTDILSNTSNRRSRSISKGRNGDKNHISDDDMYDDVDDDDIDDDNVEGDDLDGLPPWEEEDGIYGVMSRMLKNTQPTLFWTLRKGQVDYKHLRKDQIINHHVKAGTFTTKTGLAKCLNQLRWFDDKEPDEFFPRCFIISSDEEKHAFIDDFHFTACASLIKEIIEISSDSITDSDELVDLSINEISSDLTSSKSNKKILPKIKYSDKRKERSGCIDHKFLDMAIEYCEFIMKIKNHEDIDRHDFMLCWSCDWEDFLTNYYKVVHDGFRVEGAYTEDSRRRCLEIVRDLKKSFPQFDMEGSRNVWILKPGAKSRGRGIMCYSRLHDVLKLLSNSCVANENRFIVQKYIERPLLIYNTKFDIRQWFMVTDWNPLTVWWYQDCYLRFCSQQYTLDDFNEAVHLSNNSIQHKYHNGPRSELLPSENMWDWVQFEKWMKNEGYGNAYLSIILPGMKEAVIDVLLCVQDNVEWRKNLKKNSFELYGADFMVSENDLKPWLIEINSSPCMSPSTSITARLTSSVLEDVFKVILDRRENKNCDTGRFELLYKQNAIFVPPYVGIDLKLAGTSIKNPTVLTAASERRLSSRPISDSFRPFVLTQLKKKESNFPIRRHINETSLTNSLNIRKESVSKSADKPIIYHKRSSTSGVTHSSQSRTKTSINTPSIVEVTPKTSINKKPINHISYKSHDLERNISSAKVTSPPSLLIKNDQLAKCRKTKPVPKSPDTPKEVPIVTKTIPRPKSETRDSKDKLVNILKLPIVTGSEISLKPSVNKLERQYKLPNKVEIVNFALARKMMNSSLKETNLKRKGKNDKLLKRGSNSQIIFQKYPMVRSNASSLNYYKCFNRSVNFRKTLFLINNRDMKMRSHSKISSSEKLHPSTSALLCRGKNNSHLSTFIDTAMPAIIKV